MHGCATKQDSLLLATLWQVKAKPMALIDKGKQLFSFVYYFVHRGKGYFLNTLAVVLEKRKRKKMAVKKKNGDIHC